MRWWHERIIRDWGSGIPGDGIISGTRIFQKEIRWLYEDEKNWGVFEERKKEIAKIIYFAFQK